MVCSFSWARTTPNPTLTPGVLCAPTDADYKGRVYPEQIARCDRNIGVAEKAIVAQAYGNIPRTQWSNYEFDHLIPLCAGGGNDVHNLWPEPIAEAREKDKLEVQICNAMQAGRLSQAQAVVMVHQWFMNQAF